MLIYLLIYIKAYMLVDLSDHIQFKESRDLVTLQSMCDSSVQNC